MAFINSRPFEVSNKQERRFFALLRMTLAKLVILNLSVSSWAVAKDPIPIRVNSVKHLSGI